MAEPTIAEPAEMTVSEVIDRYLRHAETNGWFSVETLDERKRTLGLFVAAHGDRQVSECEPFHLTDWIDDHTGPFDDSPGWRSTSTRKSKCNQVNACFNWAARQRRIKENPFAGVNYAEAELRPAMPDDDLTEFAGLANKAFERALRFLRYTGCRLSEMCGIAWPDVDMDRGYVIVHKHKSRRHTRKAKIIVLLPEAVELLKEVRRRQAADYVGVVFLNNHNHPWNRRTLGQQLRRMKVRHGITTLATLHGIRHRWASDAVANGAPIKLVSMQLGHSSVSVTERFYLHLTGEIEAIRAASHFAMPRKPIV